MKALTLTQNLRQKDGFGEVEAIASFVRDRIRYVRDVYGVETLQTPAATLELAAGDCDDKSTLLAALLMAIGYRCQFAALNQGGKGWSHVWTRVSLYGRWVNLETCENVAVGHTVPLAKGDRLMLWDI